MEEEVKEPPAKEERVEAVVPPRLETVVQKQPELVPVVAPKFEPVQEAPALEAPASPLVIGGFLDLRRFDH